MTAAPIGAEEFEALRQYIHRVAGIQLGNQKQHLVTGRLGPRLRALGLMSYGDYLDYVTHDKSGAEARELVNCITTNKTSFFREQHHFDALKSKIVPEIVARTRTGGSKKIRIWSSACSSGQEPWSIAMTLADALGSFAGWDIKILASDLDTNVLAKAENATYDEIAVEEIPAAYRTKYLEAAPDGEFRIAKALRDVVSFRCMNLIEASSWGFRSKFDVVFCRNVAIYFDKPTQEVLFKSLAAQLEPTGYLMSGHSENLHWLAAVLCPIGNTIHVLTNPGRALPPPLPAAHKPMAAPALSVSRLRVAAAPLPQRALTRAAILSPVTGKKEVAIQVGGIHASAQGVIVKTTLGSCIAACLYDPVARVGGMNHFLLPEDKSGSRAPTNFGINAMEILITSLMKLGGDRRRFVAKVFGGAEPNRLGVTRIGKQNAEFALGYLADEGIEVIAKKLGGETAMMVVFDTGEGKAFVKQVERAGDLLGEEQRHRAKLAAQMHPVDEDIVFFGTP